MIDIIPKFQFNNSCHCATLANGDKIVHILFSRHHHNELQVCSAMKLKFDKADFLFLGLPQFIGDETKDVTTRFPELSGFKIVDGEEIINFTPNTWTSQVSGDKASYFVVPFNDHKDFKVAIESTKKVAVVDLEERPEYDEVKVWIDNHTKIGEIKEAGEVQIVNI